MSLFCGKLWTWASNHPKGHYRVCCDNNVFLSSEFPDINHPLLKQLRKSMIDGIWPKECDICMRFESLNKESSRTKINKNLHSNITELIENTQIDGSVSNSFTHYDYRFSNLCNLACVTCGPNSSSYWEKQLGIETTASTSLNPIHNGVEYIHFNGGEPLINPNHWILLDKLPSTVKLRYTTNLVSVNSKQLQKLSRFKNLKFSISVDGIEELYNFIRWPAKWSVFQKKFHLLQEFVNSDSITIQPTISIANCFYYQEIKDFFKAFKINICFVDYPTNLSIVNLPDKEVLVDELRSYANQQNASLDLYQSGINFIKSLELQRKIKYPYNF